MFWDPIKNRASSRLLAQNSVSQVFWEPIKNRVSPRSVLLEAVYLEALLYTNYKVLYLKTKILVIHFPLFVNIRPVNVCNRPNVLEIKTGLVTIIAMMKTTMLHANLMEVTAVTILSLTGITTVQ